jgi:hypothetical protein
MSAATYALRTSGYGLELTHLPERLLDHDDAAEVRIRLNKVKLGIVSRLFN